MVSIIIPVYNAEKTLGKCLDSILRGSYSDFSIIAINDGSSDNSWRILEEYKEKFPEKMEIFNQENQGVARTRNAGIMRSNSKYVMFVDCDDWIDPDYIERFVKEAEEKGLDMAIGGYRRTTEEKILFEMKLAPVEWSKYMTMAPWAKIYRKDFLTVNNIEFLDNNIGEDVFFNLQAVNLTEKISIIDYVGYNWFYNERSVSNTVQKSLEKRMDVMYLLDECYGKLEKIGATNKEEVEFYFTRYIIWYLLFAGRRSGYAELRAESEAMFAWIKGKFPEFLANKNISLFRPAGETLKNRLAVYVFLVLYRFGLSGFFLKLYSR